MVNYTGKLLKTEKPPALSLQDKDESEFFSLGSSEFFKKKFINTLLCFYKIFQT